MSIELIKEELKAEVMPTQRDPSKVEATLVSPQHCPPVHVVLNQVDQSNL